jgi:hypothetical protein
MLLFLLLFVPAPEPTPPKVVPGFYQILSGGIWDFHLKADKTLLSTHPYTSVIYTGFWHFDPKTNILTIETISGPGGSEHWNTERHLITPTGSFCVDSKIPTYFKKIKGLRPQAP